MKRLFTLMCGIFFVHLSYAQISYSVTYNADAGNPGGLNTGGDTESVTSWTSIVDGPQSANAWSPATAIPFAFDFYGTPVTHFKASQNGLVTFDTMATALPSVNDNLPSASLPNSTIAGLWDEFTNASPTGLNDDIVSKVYGTAPNRQFWIKWFSFELGNPNVSFNYFAVVLEESSNKIYVVDLYRNSGALSMTVGVQLDPSTAVQFGDNTTPNSGNSTPLTDNDYYEFSPFVVPNDDAGILSLINPSFPIIPGMQSVDVTLKNFGANNLDTVDISWEVNGMPQASLGYGTTLAPNANASVNLGMFNFATGMVDLKFWTSTPNGLTDAMFSNDTLEILGIFVCDPLSGAYTIGGAGADYATLTAAVDAMAACGISGPVTFNIAAGTYAEEVTIPAIMGASATNTITFDGGNVATVTAASGSVFLLDGADYVTLSNMTLENTGTTDITGVRLFNAANFNTISNNMVMMPLTGTTDIVGISASASATSSFTEGNNANYTMVMGNTIIGGDKGIHFEGIASSLNVGNQFIDNDISQADESGIYMDEQDSTVIMGNYIHDMRTATASDGIYCFDMMNFTIMENEVYVTDYGIYVADGNFDATPTIRAKIVNNMVSTNSDYGIYLDDINDIDVWHNSSFGRPGMRINDFTGMDIRNNIFVSDTDFAFEADETVDAEVIDFNIYESGNANLIDIISTLHVDLAAWQAATPTLNDSSLQGDPGFVSTTSDLHVLAALANDVGDNSVGVTVDIDGDTRPQAPSTTVDIGADEFTPLDFDATITELLTAEGGCGDSSTMITVVFKNQGLVAIDSLVISADVSGSLTQSLSATFLGSLPEGASDTIDLGAINTFAGGTFDLLAYTQLAGEQDPSNDSMMYSITRATSEAPTAMQSTAICAGDSTMLVGMGDGGEYFWFDSLTGGNILAQGDTFQTGPVLGPATYYVGYSEIPDSLTTTLAGGSGCGAGNMFDLTAISNITINGLTLNPNTGSGIVDSVKVWYIPKGTYVGNEQTQAAWTLLDAQAYIGQGDGTPVTVSIASLSVPAGTTYGIYVEYDANYTVGANMYANADVSISTGVGHCSPFGFPNNPRTFNGTIHYVNTVCTFERTAVDVIPTSAATASFTSSSVEFDATFVDQSSDADSVYYDYGDGSTGTDTAHTYAGVGTYTVCQVAINDCGSDTTCVMLTITCTAPMAAFTISSTELEASFNNLAMTADTIVYDYGDGTMGSDSMHTYAAAGTYTVCQIATNACESDTVCLEVMITCTAPTAGLSVMNEFLTIAITSAAADADSVVYDYGDGTTGTDTAYSYASGGVYTVCQIAYNACDTDTSCAEVAVMSVGLDRIPGLTELSVFPNPNQGQFSVEAFLDRSEAFSIELHTIRGQRVYQKDLGNSNGSIREQINVQHLSKGVYFLRIQVGIHSLTQKITITE